MSVRFNPLTIPKEYTAPCGVPLFIYRPKHGVKLQILIIEEVAKVRLYSGG